MQRLGLELLYLTTRIVVVLCSWRLELLLAIGIIAVSSHWDCDCKIDAVIGRGMSISLI